MSQHVSKPSKPFNISGHYARLGEEYFELTLFKEAETAATRALELSPRSHRARYNRAMARWNMDYKRGALVDLECLIATGGAKRFPDALESRAKLLCAIQDGDHTESGPNSTPEQIDYTWPPSHSPAAEPTVNDHHPYTLLESGGFKHSRPCWHHNHTQCSRGMDCMYSHAPSGLSIRDNDGRNVCLRYLLGHGECVRDKKCCYSHSKAGLPEDPTAYVGLGAQFTIELQWWNNPSRMREVRERLHQCDAKRKQEYEARVKARAEKGQVQDPSIPPYVMTQKTMPPPTPFKVLPQPQKAEERKGTTRPKPKQLYGGTDRLCAASERKPRSSSKKETFIGAKSQKPRKKRKALLYPMSSTVKSLQRLSNCGFTDDDVEDLLELGLNPWDDEAQSAFAKIDDY